jgi:NTP pyrophosphatase (non-canonical NTP hydrolase)
MTAGPYSIGSGVWPGLAKAGEEAGELVQVVGKIIAAGGADKHWDGSSLRARLEDEAGDLLAALAFLAEASDLDIARIGAQRATKLALFRKWHAENTDHSLNRDGS